MTRKYINISLAAFEIKIKEEQGGTRTNAIGKYSKNRRMIQKREKESENNDKKEVTNGQFTSCCSSIQSDLPAQQHKI